ncbi:MAG: 16S rRNA (adenine(1518)-N(6)/adenine(1519)-N(6))-dimethyltransferase RsmA [Pseudomonadota bacterium]
MSNIKKNIAQLPTCSAIVSSHQIQANKNFGQNFLFDGNLVHKLARLSGPLDDALILEIGPGPGALTRALLLENAKKVIAVEIDKRFINLLQPLVDAANGRFTLYHQDARKLDLTAMITDHLAFFKAQDSSHSDAHKKAVRIAANLPYNISLHLLVDWLKRVDQIKSISVLLQDEVAERVSAQPGSSQFGRLSVLAQSSWQVKKQLRLGPEHFVPKPKIYSNFVRFDPLEKTLDQHLHPYLAEITKAGFAKKRKMIRTSLKAVFDSALIPICQKGNIDIQKRAQDVTVDEYIYLSKALAFKHSRSIN